MARKVHALRKNRSRLVVKNLGKKSVKELQIEIAGLRPATLLKAELLQKNFPRFFDRKCRANSLEVTEQLFCRTPIYVGGFFVNVIKLWNVFIKISNKN